MNNTLFVCTKNNKKMKLRFLPYTSKYYHLLSNLNIEFFKKYHMKYYKTYRQDHFNEFIKNCKDFIKLIIHKGKLVGVLAVNNCKNNNMYIEYIGIIDDYKNIGIGTAILKCLMHEAKEKNKTLSLEVYKSNPAQNLYVKLGFEIKNMDEKNYYMTYNPLKV